jgi:hypothetical protein
VSKKIIESRQKIKESPKEKKLKKRKQNYNWKSIEGMNKKGIMYNFLERRGRRIL